eukprot:3442296-Rhodomonas_salina.2
MSPSDHASSPTRVPSSLSPEPETCHPQAQSPSASSLPPALPLVQPISPSGSPHANLERPSPSRVTVTESLLLSSWLQLCRARS